MRFEGTTKGSRIIRLVTNLLFDINRLIYRFINEAAACLEEGIVEDQDLLDAGIIFGTGFAPFRGGPMNYSAQSGVPETLQSMVDYETKYGERFHPANGWSLLSN